MTAITSALASARSSVTTTTSPGFEQKAAHVDNPESSELIFSIAASALVLQACVFGWDVSGRKLVHDNPVLAASKGISAFEALPASVAARVQANDYVKLLFS
jgi:hypothetical protein